MCMFIMCLVNNEKKYTRFAGDFRDHADARVRFGAHRPIDHESGLPAEPLIVSIGRLFSPYCPGVRHGHRRRGHNKHNKKKNF